MNFFVKAPSAFASHRGTSLEHLQGLAGRIVVTVATFIVQGTRDIELSNDPATVCNATGLNTGGYLW